MKPAMMTETASAILVDRSGAHGTRVTASPAKPASKRKMLTSQVTKVNLSRVTAVKRANVQASMPRMTASSPAQIRSVLRKTSPGGSAFNATPAGGEDTVSRGLNGDMGDSYRRR
jgi:hypothetical protein